MDDRRTNGRNRGSYHFNDGHQQGGRRRDRDSRRNSGRGNNNNQADSRSSAHPQDNVAATNTTATTTVNVTATTDADKVAPAASNQAGEASSRGNAFGQHENFRRHQWNSLRAGVRREHQGRGGPWQDNVNYPYAPRPSWIGPFGQPYGDIEGSYDFNGGAAIHLAMQTPPPSVYTDLSRDPGFTAPVHGLQMVLPPDQQMVHRQLSGPYNMPFQSYGPFSSPVLQVNGVNGVASPLFQEAPPAPANLVSPADYANFVNHHHHQGSQDTAGHTMDQGADGSMSVGALQLQAGFVWNGPYSGQAPPPPPPPPLPFGVTPDAIDTSDVGTGAPSAAHSTDADNAGGDESSRPSQSQEDLDEEDLEEFIESMKDPLEFWRPNSEDRHSFALMSKRMWDIYNEKCQKPKSCYAKLRLQEDLDVYLRPLMERDYPEGMRLVLVGSSLTGFGLDSSDADMCLLMSSFEIDQNSKAQQILENIMSYLRHSASKYDLHDISYVPAKVPLIKFRQGFSGVEVDLNCNNLVGILNTRLLYCYASLDWRVRPLVVVVKLWAQKHGIYDAKTMNLSSYSLSLMVIFYLMSVVDPPVLPCLQKMMADHFKALCGTRDIYEMEEQLGVEWTRSKNTMTLAQLFLGFLDFFGNYFEFDKHVISIRLGKLLPMEKCRNRRTPKNEPWAWNYIGIEEPFLLTNTAAAVYDKEVFERIVQVFKLSHFTLSRTRDVDTVVDSELVPPPPSQNAPVKHPIPADNMPLRPMPGLEPPLKLNRSPHSTPPHSPVATPPSSPENDTLAECAEKLRKMVFVLPDDLNIVDSAKVEEDLVDSAKVKEDLVDSAKVKEDLVDSAKVEEDLVDSPNMGKDLEDSAKVGKDLVDSEGVEDTPVNFAHVEEDPVDFAKVNKDPVDSAKVNKDPVDSKHLEEGLVYSVNVGKSLVDSAKVKDLVDSATVGMDLVDSVKVEDGPLDSDKEIEDLLDSGKAKEELSDSGDAKEDLLDSDKANEDVPDTGKAGNIPVDSVKTVPDTDAVDVMMQEVVESVEEDARRKPSTAESSTAKDTEEMTT